MILITGGNGLIGSAITKQLIDQNHQVRLLLRPNADTSLLGDYLNKVNVIEGDILDIKSLEVAMQGVDYVIHTAAIVSFAPRDKDKMYKVNVEGTANVVNTCLDFKIRKLAFISSVAALGRPDVSRFQKNEVITINEEQKWENSPNNSNYAKTKYLAELEVWRGVAEGLTAVVVNPSVVLGEGDWKRSSTQLFKYVFDEKPFYTDGTINYVDVKDVATATLQLLFSDIQNERFILNAGHTSYKDLLEKIAHGFNKEAPKTRISPLAAAFIWRVEAVRSWFTGKAPLITRETAKSASSHFIYENDKIKKSLGITFQSLNQTVQRVCKSLTK